MSSITSSDLEEEVQTVFHQGHGWEVTKVFFSSTFGFHIWTRISVLFISYLLSAADYFKVTTSGSLHNMFSVEWKINMLKITLNIKAVIETFSYGLLLEK